MTLTASTIVDMAGGVLLVLGLFLIVLYLPGVVALVLRELGWRRVERQQRRAHLDGFVRSEFRGFRERWRGDGS